MRIRWTWLAIAAWVLVLALAAPAAATVQVTAGGEPAFTNTANNVWWFTYNTAGAVAGRPYFLEYRLTRDGLTVYTNQTGNLARPSGTVWIDNENNGTTYTLEHGRQYTMCVTEYYDGGTGDVMPHMSACSTTRSDRQAPSIATSVNGTDEYTRDPVVDVHVEYADGLSPPWPGVSTGSGIFACLKAGSECTPTAAQWITGYASRRNANGTSAYLDYTSDLSGFADGKLHFCARVPDAARPDPGTGQSNQFAAPPEQSNLSATSCGWITLDRGAPAVSAAASTASATTGQLVTFTAAAQDPVSGPGGTYTWAFGDNTAAATGASVTHTYTQPGTYQARVETSDGAGNTGAATVTVTVTTPPAPPAPPAPPSGGPTPPTGPGPTPPVADPRGGGGTVTGTAPSTTVIQREVGGGGVQRTTVGSLSVTAPKRVVIGRTKRLPLALTATAGGRVTVALVRGGTIVAKGALTISAPGTFGYRLTLPKKVRPGRHVLKLTFTPKGGGKVVTKTLAIRFVKR